MSSFRRPVITIPVRLQRRAVKRQEKQRLKELEESGTAYPKGDRTKPAVIACRRSELNLYQGQRQNPFRKMTLASEHWKSRSTIGDYFSISGLKPKPSLNWFDNVISEATLLKLGGVKPTFKNFGLDPTILKGLETLGFEHPTNIQNASLPTLLEGRSSIVAAETGNGKTLAFLLPILQRTLEIKTAAPKSAFHKNRPLAVIVTPGRELTYQIFQVARDLVAACREGDDRLNINVGICLGGQIDKKLNEMVKGPLDVLVGTLGGLRKMFDERFYYAGSAATIVFDEADTMFDDTFGNQSKSFLCRLSRLKPDGPVGFGDSQLVFVGATFPREIKNIMEDLVDTDQMPVLRTGQLHRVPLHLAQKFIKTGKTNKTDYLLDAIETDVAKKRPVLLFSNKTSTCNFLHHFLREKGIDSDIFNSSVYWKIRYKSLENFKAGKVNVLSCTDLASRGIDFTDVHHVINYDFPENLSDYLHRVGRVGRAGSKVNAKITNFVCTDDGVSVVQELESAVRLGRELQGVDNNIHRIIGERIRLEQEIEI